MYIDQEDIKYVLAISLVPFSSVKFHRAFEKERAHSTLPTALRKPCMFVFCYSTTILSITQYTT